MNETEETVQNACNMEAPSGCWFNLPNGETARELEVTVPVKGRILLNAEIAREFDDWRSQLIESMEKQKWALNGSLSSMLTSCIGGYEHIAADALAGAGSVRDDMLVMLRSVQFVLETVVGDHLNHRQKNERIRGCMGVLERHIESLREERFEFRHSVWKRHHDLFRWDEPERRLRQKIQELEQQLVEAKKDQVAEIE